MPVRQYHRRFTVEGIEIIPDAVRIHAVGAQHTTAAKAVAYSVHGIVQTCGFACVFKHGYLVISAGEIAAFHSDEPYQKPLVIQFSEQFERGWHNDVIGSGVGDLICFEYVLKSE